MGALEYEELVRRILGCTLCRLHENRVNAVPGEGSLEPRVMFVGEAPGRSEDEQGRPFVGAAGKLLDYLLSLAGLSREEVYITNVVKCRPPGNRDPREDEVHSCNVYLRAQLRLIRPGSVVALGRIAGRTLYGMAGVKWRGVKAARARPVKARIEGLGLMLYATYHPAAVLYNPGLREELEEDFRTVVRSLATGPPRRRGGTLEEFMS